MSQIRHRSRVLPVVVAGAIVILLAGSLAARYMASERTVGASNPAPDASVAAPVSIDIQDLEVPPWGSMKESRDWAVTFQTDLDLLAPLGDGPGNAAEDLGRVFEKFGRGKEAAERGVPGTGLGLYLSRRIIEEHGGVLGVESIPGQGSTFRFSLKVAP